MGDFNNSREIKVVVDMDDNISGKKGPQYRNYLIAFVDILGFSEIVKRSKDEQEYFNLILEALKIIEHTVLHNEGKREEGHQLVNMTQFSDSLVISRPYTHLAFFSMVMNLDFIQKVLADIGIMVRGGLTSGLLYHQGSIAFGPAFIKAYEFESKVANYPRIIIDPALMDGSAVPPPYGEAVDEDFLQVSTRGTLTKDDDGYYFIDFLGGYFSGNVNTEKLEETISFQLSNILNNDGKTIRIKEKLEWMQRYINKCKQN